MTSTPTESVPDYRHTVEEGDYVRLPDGRTGTIYMIEHVLHERTTVVSLWLDKPKRRFFGLFKPIPLRFAGHEIDQLELIAKEMEVERDLQ